MEYRIDASVVRYTIFALLVIVLFVLYLTAVTGKMEIYRNKETPNETP